MIIQVIDSSDLILHVLDARDPMGTRCESVESYLAKEKRGKKVVYILNKVDLVPGWVAVSRNFSSFRSVVFCSSRISLPHSNSVVLLPPIPDDNRLSGNSMTVRLPAHSQRVNHYAISPLRSWNI
jgi:50S ribosomal subunit-associated GTPase HflX